MAQIRHDIPPGQQRGGLSMSGGDLPLLSFWILNEAEIKLDRGHLASEEKWDRGTDIRGEGLDDGEGRLDLVAVANHAETVQDNIQYGDPGVSVQVPRGCYSDIRVTVASMEKARFSDALRDRSGGDGSPVRWHAGRPC